MSEQQASELQAGQLAWSAVEVEASEAPPEELQVQSVPVEEPLQVSPEASSRLKGLKLWTPGQFSTFL